MTTAQAWRTEGELKGKIEGKKEGEHKKARLMVLRGKWKEAPIDFLIYQSELPEQEVQDLFKGYDEVFWSWQMNKAINRTNARTKYLSELEVEYLLDLFHRLSRWA